MMRRILLGVAIVALGASQGLATTLIDDFFTAPPIGFQQACASNTAGLCFTSPTDTGTLAGTNTLSGNRQITVGSLNGGSSGTVTGTVVAGRLQISSSNDTSGRVSLFWTGAAGAISALDTYLAYTYSVTDTAGIVSFLACSDTGFTLCGPTYVAQNIADGVNPGGASSFGLFNLFGGTVTDASLIRGIMFSFDGRLGADIDFDNFATGVPEPSTLALLGAGLVGVGFIRRRK
jgi:hypothetical protein